MLKPEVKRIFKFENLLWSFLIGLQITLPKVTNDYVFGILLALLLISSVSIIYMEMFAREKTKEQWENQNENISIINYNDKKVKNHLNPIKKFLIECVTACREFYSYKPLPRYKVWEGFYDLCIGFLFCFLFYQSIYFFTRFLSLKEKIITPESKLEFLIAIPEKYFSVIIIGFFLLEKIIIYKRLKVGHNN